MTRIFALNKRVILLILLFVFAFFIRFMFINKGPFHWDTLDLAIAAQKTLSTHILHYEHGTGYPLTVICGAFMILIFKPFGITDPVFCVNFMSVLAGTISVILLFFLTEKLFDISTGPKAECGNLSAESNFRKAFFAAVLLACFMPHVAISTFGKSLTLSICLALAGAYYMLVYTQGHKPKHLLYSAVFLGFCGAARLSDIFIFAPITYLYFSEGKIDYARIKNFIVFVIVFVLTAAIYYLPMLLDKGIAQFVEVWQSAGGAQYVGIFSDVFKYNSAWMKNIFSADGFALFLAGFGYMIVKKQYRPFIFLMIWFLALFTFYAGISSSGPRYLVIAWIPLIIAQGSFLGDFGGKKRLLAFLALGIMTCVNFFKYTPVLEFRHRYALQQEFARWVNEETEPDAMVIAMDESIFIEYYGKRKVILRPMFKNKFQIDRFFQQLDGFFSQGKKVYVIGTACMSYDADGAFRRALLDKYRVVCIGRKDNEDWHHALLDQVFLKEALFRLEKKDE